MIFSSCLVLELGMEVARAVRGTDYHSKGSGERCGLLAGASRINRAIMQMPLD